MKGLGDCADHPMHAVFVGLVKKQACPACGKPVDGRKRRADTNKRRYPKADFKAGPALVSSGLILRRRKLQVAQK